MQKTAQTRNIWNRMREGIGWDNKAMQKANQRMRDTDDQVRAIIAGEAVGTFQPLTEKKLKDIIKSARTHLNRKEYAKSIGDLALFHKCIVATLDVLKSFDDNLSEEHTNFILQPVDPNSEDYDEEYAQYLEDLRKRFIKKEPNKTASAMVKDAGIKDFLSNRLTERGRENAAWAKAYPRRARLITNKTKNMIEVSEKLLSSILTNLKTMAKFRDSRQIEHWYDVVKKMIKSTESYHNSFETYYDSELKNLLGTRSFINKPSDKSEPVPEAETLKEEVVEPLDTGTVPGEPTAEQLAAMQTGMRGKVRPTVTDTLVDKPTGTLIDNLPDAPAVPARDRSYYDKLSPVTFPSNMFSPESMRGEFMGAPASEFKLPTQKPHVPKLPEPRTQPDQLNLPGFAHKKFFSSLEALSNERPAVLTKFILKYAESIQESDPLTYDKLINIVKSIKV